MTAMNETCRHSVGDLEYLGFGYMRCRKCNYMYRMGPDGLERFVSGMPCDLKKGCSGQLFGDPEGTDEGLRCTECDFSIRFGRPE